MEDHTFVIAPIKKSDIDDILFISWNNLLDYLFNINSTIKKQLDSLTPNPNCHPALIAFAYLSTRKKNSADFINLAVLYAEAGLIRGTLFILEFYQTYQAWSKHNVLQPASQSSKNDALISILYTSLRWADLGGNIAKYMANHYNFKFKASTLYACIINCRPFMSAINILFLDFRHYESPAEFLKAVLIAAQYISEFCPDETKNYTLQPIEIETLKKINALLKSYYSQLPHLPDSLQHSSTDTKAINSLNMITGFEQELLNKLDPILTILENNTEDFDSNSLLGHLFTVKSNSCVEDIGDLQKFCEIPPAEKQRLYENAKAFMSEARKLYRLIINAPQNTPSLKPG